MEILLSALLALYFTSLFAFSFVTSPVGYCLLLVFSALSVSAYAYLIIGFSWYLVLFCLVYVGGVYILFIFISIYNPNAIPVSKKGYWPVVVFFMLTFFVFFVVGFSCDGFKVDYSHGLCSGSEGLAYMYLCLVLMLGFVVISVVSSDKDSFYR